MEVNPFKLVLGHNPKLLSKLLCKNQVVKVQVRIGLRWKDKNCLSKSKIACVYKARKMMLKYANQKQRMLKSNEGDKMLLKLTPQIKKKILESQSIKG